MYGVTATGKRQVGRVDPAATPWDTKARFRAMPDLSPAPPPAGNPWPRAVTIIAVLLILVGAGVWLAGKLVEAPGATLGGATKLAGTVGSKAVEVARAFREGTIKQEFLSHATELSGSGRLQVATLKQRETFLREEAGSTAWGLIPVPKVVVQAQAPVEYTYFVDLNGVWEFRQQDKVITVIPPTLEANTPALDVSALTFYTLEGSIWRDDQPVRDRLRQTFTASLRKRARNNESLVREIGRREIGSFVEKWLAEKFGDAQNLLVKVVFPDELPPEPTEKPPQ